MWFLRSLAGRRNLGGDKSSAPGQSARLSVGENEGLLGLQSVDTYEKGQGLPWI